MLHLRSSRHNSFEELACSLIENPGVFLRLEAKRWEGLRACLRYFVKEKNSIMIKWLIKRGVSFDINSSVNAYMRNLIPSEYSLSQFDCELTPLEHSVLNLDKESTALLASQQIALIYYTINPLLHIAALLEEESILESLLKNVQYKREIDHSGVRDLLEYVTKEERIKQVFLTTANIDLSIIKEEKSIHAWHHLTPLHIAVAFKRKNNIRVLLENGANPHLCEDNGFSPLMCALHDRDIEIVKLFLEGKTYPSLAERAFCLSLAAMDEDSSILALLLQHEAFTSAINTISYCPLIYEYQLMKGTPYKFYDFTPLHAAIESQRINNICLLLENGADPNLCNIRGKLYDPSPLMFAFLKKHLPTMRLLLEKGGNIYTMMTYLPYGQYDRLSLSPLHFAVSQGNQEMLDLLLSVPNVNMDFPNAEGETPLMWAKTGEMVRFLIEKGASPHLTDINGRNALFFTAEKDEDYLPALLEHEVSTNVISQKYGTCLFANFKSFTNLQLLLPYIDKETFTKLHITKQNVQRGESILSKAMDLPEDKTVIEIIKAMAKVGALTEEDLLRASFLNLINVVRHLLESSEDIKSIVKNDNRFHCLCKLNQHNSEILELLRKAKEDSNE